MRKILLLLVLFVTVGASSQSINDYQYVIVPTKFSIFKENDKFKMNTLTKLLLEKYGFKVFMSTDAIPNNIGDNCQRLYADLVQDKDFFVTKIKIVLKDCKERVVYETELGRSREKDYATAYNYALRETAKSFDKLNYKYSGKEVVATPAETQPTTVVRVSDERISNTAATPITSSGSEEFYFAQPTTTGFQIVDSTPKVIMRLFNTSQKDVFIGERENAKGTVLIKNGQWFFEYYENGKLISEHLKLKF